MKLLDKLALHAYIAVLKRLTKANDDLRKTLHKQFKDNEAMKVHAKIAFMALEGHEPDYVPSIEAINQAQQELAALLKIDY